MNAGWQDSQFWDGRAENLVEQAKDADPDPIEMGMPERGGGGRKTARHRGVPTALRRCISRVKSHAITYQNMAEAIAAFERTLITPSRFDDFLRRRHADALNETEQRGLQSFPRS